MSANPIVKWAGGKTRLLGELCARIPTRMRVYAEPFAGGAALFFALAADVDRKGNGAGTRSFERAILSDRNAELVDCYCAVRDDVEGVIGALKRYRYDRDLFYETRSVDPQKLSRVDRAARLIFLNRTCFNGLWRVNAGGKFNVPFGRYTNPKICDERGLRAASDALQCAEIVCGDFSEVTAGLGAGDFVYLDPPYVPLTRTADFTSYVAGGFSRADHERLAEQFRLLKERGALAMLSNADTPWVREAYSDFCVQVVRAPRAINSKPDRRGDLNELLVTSWGHRGVSEVSVSRARVTKLVASSPARPAALAARPVRKVRA